MVFITTSEVFEQNFLYSNWSLPAEEYFPTCLCLLLNEFVLLHLLRWRFSHRTINATKSSLWFLNVSRTSYNVASFKETLYVETENMKTVATMNEFLPKTVCPVARCRGCEFDPYRAQGEESFSLVTLTLPQTLWGKQKFLGNSEDIKPIK